MTLVVGCCKRKGGRGSRENKANLSRTVKVKSCICMGGVTDPGLRPKRTFKTCKPEVGKTPSLQIHGRGWPSPKGWPRLGVVKDGTLVDTNKKARKVAPVMSGGIGVSVKLPGGDPAG